MKNDARKMALENQIELAQQNAIDFTHACMTIALHDVFGVGKDRLDKVTQRKDEINGELMRRMAIPAKNQKAQLNEAEKWLGGVGAGGGGKAAAGSLAQDEKSLAVRLTLMSEEGSLADAQIEQAVQAVLAQLQARASARLR